MPMPAYEAAIYKSLVAPFKQRGIVRNRDKSVQYGMCVGLSVDWVLRHKN